MNQLHKAYGDRVTFMLVYIREAHAIDSRLPMVYGSIEDPVSEIERHALAQMCSDVLQLTMPAVVDRIDDAVARAYHAWPERLYLIDRAGKITYRCGPGPFGYDPDGLEVAIRDELGLNK